MDAVTYELDQDESAIVAAGPRLRRPRGQARRARARARQHLPGEAHRADEGARHLRPGDPASRGATRRSRRPATPLVTEELARGWMSLAGAMGGHTVVAKLLARASAPRSRRTRYLPRMATGEVRATMALTEPGGGSRPAGDAHDRAARDGDELRRQRLQDLDHQRPPLAADRAAVQDRPGRRPGAPRASASCWSSTGPGFTVSRDLPKLGYKGVESCELAFDDYRVPGDGAARRRRGTRLRADDARAGDRPHPGRRPRARRRRRAALEDSLRYAQERESFGQPIWQHQSIGNYLADMATKLTAARQLVLLRRRAATTPASAPTWRPAWPSCSPRRPRCRSP